MRFDGGSLVAAQAKVCEKWFMWIAMNGIAAA
jgi:hypothetical protein